MNSNVQGKKLCLSIDIGCLPSKRPWYLPLFRYTNVRIMNPGELKAIIEIVPDLIWATDFLGPQ